MSMIYDTSVVSPLSGWGEAGKTAGWHIPDPAGQFASPYLGMGNNPVAAVDPDGRFVDRIRGIQSRGLALYAYATYLRTHGYRYLNGIFLQPSNLSMNRIESWFDVDRQQARERAQRIAIQLEKLGLSGEPFGRGIILDYTWATDETKTVYSQYIGSWAEAYKAFGNWLKDDATLNQSEAFLTLFQQEYNQLPDYRTITNSERVRYIIEAGAASKDKLVNLNTIFKNFSPNYVRDNDGWNVGLAVNRPVHVTLNGKSYRIGINLGFITYSDQSFNPIVDLSINTPKYFENSFGTGIVFNRGHKASWMVFIYGNGADANDFWDYYYGK